MKRFLSLTFLIALAFGFSGCEGGPTGITFSIGFGSAGATELTDAQINAAVKQFQKIQQIDPAAADKIAAAVMPEMTLSVSVGEPVEAVQPVEAVPVEAGARALSPEVVEAVTDPGTIDAVLDFVLLIANQLVAHGGTVGAAAAVIAAIVGFIIVLRREKQQRK